MRSFSLSFPIKHNKNNILYKKVLFCPQLSRGLALFYVLVMMARGGRDMKTFLAPLAFFVLLAVCLTGCLREDSFDSVKVDGDMSTVFRAGSGPSHMYSRTRTGISF